MPPNAQMLAETNVVIDRLARTITLTRTFAAPRAQVFEPWARPEHVACWRGPPRAQCFEACTRPDQVARWWAPAGERLTECETRPRPGRALRFVNQGPRDVPRCCGSYRERAPLGERVSEAMGGVGRGVLEACGG